MQKNIYGIRVVKDNNQNGIMFEGFEGIIIYPSKFVNNQIEIVKMEYQNGKYIATAAKIIPPEKVIEHGKTCGKAKAEFLFSQARTLATKNEAIAFTEKLAENFRILDDCWKQTLMLRKQLDV